MYKLSFVSKTGHMFNIHPIWWEEFSLPSMRAERGETSFENTKNIQSNKPFYMIIHPFSLSPELNVGSTFYW